MTGARGPQPAFGRNRQPNALDLMPGLRPKHTFGLSFRPFCAGACIDNRDIGNESIATLWKSLNKSRILSRVP
jgi:hypothetical protein